MGPAIVAVPGTGAPSWASFAVEGEHVPEWADRLDAAATVDRMLFDSQVWSLFGGLVLPLQTYDWWIDPNGADAGATDAFAADLGLPVGSVDEPGDGEIVPGVYRFDWLQHLWEASLAIAHGHYYFETVGEYDAGDGLWHLRKLAPRPPASIAEILIDPRDGGLRAIRQTGTVQRRGDGQLFGVSPVIDVDRLLAYVWLPDGRRRWTGRSMLRAIYREWLVKDRLLRVDAINHERAGGVPTIETDATYQGSSLQELQELASQFRVGEEAGSALPPGAHMVLARAGGTDVVGSMRYLDEGMARAWGAMVRQLGQTVTGSRALGGTFADLEAMLRQVVASWLAGTFREHLIEDWWSYNVEPVAAGRPVPHPVLRWRPPALEGSSAAAVPSTGPAPGGAPVPPDPLRARSRRRGRAGVAGAARDAVSGVRAARDADRGRGGADALFAAALTGVRLPARPLRRGPYPQEVRAAVDFAALDVAFEQVAASVEGLWEGEWLPAAIDAVEAAILYTRSGSPRQRVTKADMARIAVEALPLDALTDLLLDAARSGAIAAADEMLGQGVTVLVPSDEQLLAGVVDHARAVARQAADGLSLAASRRAVQLAQGRTAEGLAGEVTAYMRDLAHRWERDQLSGAVQQAQNSGRFQVFGRVPGDVPVQWFSSELLDAATCEDCLHEDGSTYPDLAAAMRAYPSGGFMHCRGGARCRGTVVAALPEDVLDPVEVGARPELWGA